MHGFLPATMALLTKLQQKTCCALRYEKNFEYQDQLLTAHVGQKLFLVKIFTQNISEVHLSLIYMAENFRHGSDKSGTRPQKNSTD